jgi:hypothetical protein
MRTWLKYVLFGGHRMGFIPQTIEFGVKFKLLLKIYAITWKYGLNTSYLVAIRWVLFPSYLSLVSNSNFCWKFMQITWKDGWNMSYMVVTRCVLASPRVLNKSRIKVKVENDLNMCFMIKN